MHLTSGSVHATESVLFATLIQLVVIILAARAAGILFRRLGQPSAVGEIIAGLLLGPSFLGHFFPAVSKAIFNTVAATPMLVISQIGLILLMFQIGSDFEFGHLRRGKNRTAVIAIGASSVATPLCLGLLLGWLTAPIFAPKSDPFTYSLFVGVALAITAVPILGRIMREYSLTRTEVGVITISCAAVNDVIGWILLAGISAYASSRFSGQQLTFQVAGVFALSGVLWFAGRPAADWLLRTFPIVKGSIPSSLMAIVLAIIFVTGICTAELGIFTIFGGFAAGLLFHRYPAFVEAWRAHIGQFVLVFFLPVFFTFTGLRTNILGLTTGQDWMWCLLFLGAAIAGKIIPCYVAARFTGFSNGEAALIGVMMNTRALMELIVLNIGFDLHVIPQNVFTMLVIMAVTTTIMTAPLLRILLPRAGHKLAALVEA